MNSSSCGFRICAFETALLCLVLYHNKDHKSALEASFAFHITSAVNSGSGFEIKKGRKLYFFNISQAKWTNTCVRRQFLSRNRKLKDFSGTLLKYWTDDSKGYIQGLVAVTALTLGFRTVSKSTKTFTTSGFAELLSTFLKLRFIVNKGPWEEPRIWNLEHLSSGPVTLLYWLILNFSRLEFHPV